MKAYSQPQDFDFDEQEADEELYEDEEEEARLAMKFRTVYYSCAS